MLNALLKSRKFWTAVFALVTKIIFHFVPNFPNEIWIAIDALVGVVLVAIIADDATGGEIRNIGRRK